MIRRLFISIIVLFSVSCAVKPIPLTDTARAITPTPTVPCDIVEELAPERPTIPRPAVIPISTLAPQPAFESMSSDLVDAPFLSPLIGKEMPILIYLPPGYHNSTRRYPVLYMLSGYAGDYREWATYGLCRALDAFIRGGAVQPMILVMPEGEKSWWFNHAPVPGSDGKPWGDYVWKDVVGYVDANYRTLPRRASRAIGGLSSGGQSALMLGLTHPEVFSIVGAHSPSFRGADGSLAIFGNPEYFKQYDPIWLFQNRTTWKQLAIWTDVGADDQQWGDSIKDFRASLVQLGVPHQFQNTWRGAHNSDYWAAHLDDYLMWYAAKLAGE